MKLLMAFGFDLVWIVGLWWLLWGRIRFGSWKAWIAFNLMFVCAMGIASAWTVSFSGLALDAPLRTSLLFVWALGFWALLQIHFAFAYKAPLKALIAAGLILTWFFVRLFLLKEVLDQETMQIMTVLLGVGALLFWWQLFRFRGYPVDEVGR